MNQESEDKLKQLIEQRDGQGTAKPKHPGGRPTAYRPEYCKEIVEFMSQGKHAIQFAARLGVAKQTVYDWTKAHPEFLDAFKRAQAASTNWWLELHQRKASGEQREGSDVLIIQMLKVKDRDEFGEKQQLEIEQKPSSVVSKLSGELLAAMAKELKDGSNE